jgi:Right handed beta helix region
MALPTTAVWEVRPGTGSDTNGGGFDSSKAGTDYSQQNSKNSSGNNKSTTDAVAVGTTTLTSATASFTSAIVGNIIFLTGSGITVGWYEVVTFTNSTTVTLDSSPGTGTGLTMNIGGALATIEQAFANMLLVTVGGNITWVKATATYTATGTLNLAGQNDFPMSFIGYTTTRGDGGQVTWTISNSSPLVTMATGNQFNWLFENFIFEPDSGSPGDGFDGGLTGQNYLCRFKNCKFTGFTVAIALGYVNSVHFNASCLFFENCEITGCSSHGMELSGSNFLIGCYIHGNGGDGVHITATNSGTSATGACHFERCVIYNNTGNGIFVDQMNPSTQIMTWPQVINCAIVDNNGDGIQLNSGAGNNFNAFVLVNNIIESNQGFGINSVHSGAGYLQIEYNNAFGSGGTANASGNYNNLTADPTDITLTAEAFTTVGSNWTLNSTSGGGAACKAVGFPSSIP